MIEDSKRRRAISADWLAEVSDVLHRAAQVLDRLELRPEQHADWADLRQHIVAAQFSIRMLAFNRAAPLVHSWEEQTLLDPWAKLPEDPPAATVPASSLR